MSGSTLRCHEGPPIPRARMNRNCPSITFLSCAISASRPSASGRSPAMSARSVFMPIALQMRAHPAGLLLRTKAQPGRRLERQRAADRHALAVQQAVGITGRRLERVAERVAKVEQRAVALFGLVARDDIGLHLHRPAHRLGAQPGIARRQRGPVRLEPFEERLVAEQPVFHHLAVTGQEIARGQRVEHTDISQHQAGLMERADQVLALGRVDPGLAADRLNRPAPAARSGSARSAPRAATRLRRNPPRSPMTPPPSATTTSRRSTFCSSSHSTARENCGQPFVASPGGSSSATLEISAAARPACNAPRCRAATVSSVSTATRGRASSGARCSPARAISPCPIRTS